MVSIRKSFSTAEKVTLIGALITLSLAIIKIIYGLKGNSHSLFADGLHSLSDLFVDSLVFFASRFGGRDPDEEHPYGHGRIETIATLALSTILIITGAAISYDAAMHLMNSVHQTFPEIYVLGIAAFSILANELLFTFTLKIGEKIRSKLLIANAWHHRGDSASSFVVLIGVIGSLFGIYWCDAVAAILVGILIIKMAWELGWSSMQELVDAGVDPKKLLQYEQAILLIPGVIALHQLRTRSSAEKVFIDVHVLVEPRLSVSEGHYISANVVKTLRKDFPEIVDVTVHIDYESDDDFLLSEKLPPTTVMRELFNKACAKLPGFEMIEKINFHYEAGQVHIEIFMRAIPEFALPNQELQQVYQDALNLYPIFRTVEIWWKTG